MMRKREFFLWFCTALWHGIVIFFGWVSNSLLNVYFGKLNESVGEPDKR